MSSQMTSWQLQEKLLKGEGSRNQAILPIFIGSELSSTTVSMTQLFSRESSKKSSAVFRKQACILQHIVLCWQNKSWHVPVMTIVASLKMHLDATMISHCQGDDTFVTFQPNYGNFLFLEKVGIHFFSKDVYVQPLYFSRSPNPTQLSLLFCAGIQFSHDSIHVFNDQI